MEHFRSFFIQTAAPLNILNEFPKQTPKLSPEKETVNSRNVLLFSRRSFRKEIKEHVWILLFNSASDKLNRVNRYISPSKTLEYNGMSTGFSLFSHRELNG